MNDIYRNIIRVGILITLFLAGMYTIPKFVRDDYHDIRYKIDDCLQSKSTESWEKPRYIVKILEIGKLSYRTAIRINNQWYVNNNDMDSLDFLIANLIMEKVECPK